MLLYYTIGVLMKSPMLTKTSVREDRSRPAITHRHMSPEKDISRLQRLSQVAAEWSSEILTFFNLSYELNLCTCLLHMRQNIIKMLWLRISLRGKNTIFYWEVPITPTIPCSLPLLVFQLRTLSQTLPRSQTITKSWSFEYLNVLQGGPLMSFSALTSSLTAYVMYLVLALWPGMVH